MSRDGQPARIVRFGVFEFDLRSGELRKRGLRIKLQEQPCQVLGALLQHPGEVVTRETLRVELWPADTFIDFDNGLNTAVNRLRDALGDSPASPHFIETVPRRGYRFIAAVENNGHISTGTKSAVVRYPRHWKAFTFALLLAIGAVFTMTAVRRRWHPSRLTERDFVVLGDVSNSTGDAVYDRTLRQGLSVQLEQSPFIKLVSEEQIHQTLRRMGQNADAPLTPDVAREVCQRTNSIAALNGSIALLGTRYDLILKAIDCASGEVLASAEAGANDKSHVFDALGKIASDIRRQLGESLSSVQKYNTPLEQATTPSLEALRSLSLGDHTLFQTGDFAATLPFYRHAIELDPNFAMAYLSLADADSTIGETISTAKNIQKAFQLRAGVSELEKLQIEGDYYYFVTGDLAKARETFEIITLEYPRDDYAHTILADLSNITGQYDAALGHCLEALRLAPFDSNVRRHLIFTYLLSNRIDDAAAAAREAHAKELDSGLAPVMYEIAFYRGDVAEMTRQAANVAGNTGQENLFLALQADTAAYFGHLRTARELSLRAAESAARAGEQETSAGYYAVSALREALFGNANRARQQTALAMRHPIGRDAEYAIALALAFTGDTNRAQQFADDLTRKFPEDTVLRSNYLPTLRARLAIARSQTEQAFRILGTPVPYELGLPSGSFYNWPNLYPVYVRGQSYLAARRGGDAAEEFKSILDHRSIVLNEPIGAIAHLQLGRAYTLSGDTVKARAAYRDFLALWRDADSDIPILKQAKAEYAKLQ